MKTKPLYNFVKFPNYHLKISLNGDLSINLLNESCHYLFNNLKLKKQFFTSMSSNDLVIFNCGLEKFEYLPNARLINNLNTFEDLLNNLENLLGCSLIDYSLSNLIIDNLSVYYWDLKILNRSNYKSLDYSNPSPTNYYQKLNEMVEIIKDKFKCNVIITSWDINFDKGYNYNWRPVDDLSSLSSLSYLPSNYLLCFDYILHIDGSSKKYFNKLENKWVIIGKE